MAIEAIYKDGELITSSSTISSTKGTASTTPGGDLDKTAFLQLLCTQMEYQDPLEPQADTEYIAQLAQFSSLESMQNIEEVGTRLQAANLIGQDVIMKVTSNSAQESGYISGTVDYVIHENGGTYLGIGDYLYDINDLDTVCRDGYLEEVKEAQSELESTDTTTNTDETE